MTRLHTLRKRLSALRRMRAWARRTAAVAPLTTVALCALAGVLVLDLVFEMNVAQRLLVISVAAAAIGWALLRFTLPLLRVVETDLDMALLVERKQRIDNDLIAALQFECPQASRWGSPRLQAAVIERGADWGAKLNVFAAFSARRMARRGLAALAAIVVLAVLAAWFPRHASVFLNRLLLGSLRYPTRTVIQRVVVDGEAVLRGDSRAPRTVESAQHGALTFAVQCSGDLPETGAAELTSMDSGRKRRLDLRMLTIAQRRERLGQAIASIRGALSDNHLDVTARWSRQTASLVRFDAPQAAELIAAAADNRETLKEALAETERIVRLWPGRARETAVYQGRLERLVDPIHYTIVVGDARTRPGRVDMIPLPAVETRLTTIPPAYARARREAVVGSSARQLTVLDGSEVQLAVECVNGKRLRDVSLVARTGEASRRYSLASQDEQGRRWSLSAEDSPFRAVAEEIRFEIQVVDEDGLSLERPIVGCIGLKTDQAPAGEVFCRHRVFLPSGRPEIEYRAADDYGIAELRLHIEVDRSRPKLAADGQPTALTIRRRTVPVGVESQPLLADQLPLQGVCRLGLAPLQLVSGDLVSLTLEVVDYRGELEGQSYRTDPILMEISDRSGVCAANSEYDVRSDEALAELEETQLRILLEESL
jgi:hypothetical protein